MPLDHVCDFGLGLPFLMKDRLLVKGIFPLINKSIHLTNKSFTPAFTNAIFNTVFILTFVHSFFRCADRFLVKVSEQKMMLKYTDIEVNFKTRYLIMHI